MAQTMRAILLASAMATKIFGLRTRSRSSHDPSRMDLAPIQFSRDIAPMINRRRMSDCPALDTRPSRSLPPDHICLGTSPSQAAKSRPHLNVSIRRRKGLDRQRGHRPDARHCLQPARSRGQRRLRRDFTGLGLNAYGFLSNLFEQVARFFSRQLGKIACLGLKDFDNPFEMHRPLRHRMAVFVEHRAKCIRKLGALMHQPLARPRHPRRSRGGVLCKPEHTRYGRLVIEQITLR